MPMPSFPSTELRARDDAAHRQWLLREARRQVDFFRPSLQPDGSFALLDLIGLPLPQQLQELHTTTRLVHSFALAHVLGLPDCQPMIHSGMDALWTRHRDQAQGGYFWSINAEGPVERAKLAYGHVFVLLAAASAKQAGHPDADRLIADITEVLDRHFWEEERGLFQDEFTHDWQVFSGYRGMNANMHGVEALLAAYEVTGRPRYLEQAGRILDFFTAQMAPAHDWRLPEHYTVDWQVDADYRGNPVFRPSGTTPGHSLEIARLLLQYWHLCDKQDPRQLEAARHLIERALSDAWLGDEPPQGGGLAYTLGKGGAVAVATRFWWPVTEAIGAVAMLQNADPRPEDEIWYRRLWAFADACLIDHQHGGWFPELDDEGRPASSQFEGKPDLYHALQAVLLPLAREESRLFAQLRVLTP